MSVSVNRENLAARVGRWSARHWKTAVFGWLAFVVVAFGIGGMVGTKSLSVNEPGPGESGRVQRILNDEFEQPAKELVLVQSSSLTAASARFHAAVQDVVRRLEAQPNVTNIDSPFAPGSARPGVERRAFGAGRVRHPRQVRGRQGQGRADPGDGRGRAARESSVHDRRVRRWKREQGDQRPVRQGSAEGGRALAARDAGDPAADVRGAGRRRAFRCCSR